MHSTVKKALMLAKNRRKYASGGVSDDDHLTGSVELGQPDEASQEAFLQEQIQGSAPQYMPEEGMLTGKRAGLMAAGFAPGAGIATAAGQFPTAEGGLEPSMAEDWRKGEYLSAGLKGLGAAGDIAYGVPLVGPAVGAAMKAPLVAKLASISAPLYHGSKIKDLVELGRSERGPLGPGVYTSTFPNVAERYAGAEGKVYEVPHEGLDIYRGEGHRTDEEYFGYKNDKSRLIESVPEEHKETIIPLIEKMSGSDGYPLYQRIKGILGSDEAAQGLFKKAGFHGISGQVDGPETVIFDPIKIKTAKSEPTRITNPIGMYSAAAEAARALPQEKGTLQQMLATMKGVTPEELHWSGVHEAFAGKPTVTREELAKHFEERLPGVSETVLVNEPIKGNGWESVGGGTKFGGHTIPGGENYREVLLHLPNKSEAQMLRDEAERRGYGDKISQWPDQEFAQRYRQVVTNAPKEEGVFKSSHWDQPNVLSHLRMSDRTGPEGEKILHLEELQSDWGQKGRKEGFAQKVTPELQEKVATAVSKLNPKFVPAHVRTSNGAGIDAENFLFRDINHWKETGAITPEDAEALTEYSKIKSGLGLLPAPYVASPEGKHTLSWVDLGLKRALKEAAEGGYDKLIWTPGPEQAARYDLSKQVRSIDWNEYETDRYPGVNKIVQIELIEGNTIELPVDSKGRVAENVGTQFDGKPLDEVIGKDLANKILNDRDGSLSGSGLQIGGEGMKSFYDKIVPNQLQKIVKKLDKDAKVQFGGYPITAERGKPTQYADFDEWNNAPEFSQINAHVIQITPKMREAILKGFAAYADGGAVKPRDSSHLDPIIQRGMTAVKRAKSQNGGSKMMINRKMYEPIRGLKIKQPPEELSDEPDIRAYQLKRHSHEFIGSPEPEAPKRSVYLDAPLFGVRKKLFDMPYYYQPAVQRALNFAYGQKTTPFYLFEPTAPLARAIDAYETAKFIQRDPKSFSSYTGVPGTLMGITKMGVPAVASGAYLAGDGPADQGPTTKTLPDFDFGETFNVISHPKSEPKIKKEEDFIKYAKGGSVDDEFHALMAEADDLLEKFKE